MADRPAQFPATRRNPADTFSRVMLGIENVLRVVASGCLLAVMLIIFSDVFARYLFNAPLIWSYELVGLYLMPALFYFSVSDTLAEHHHIAVDLLSSRIPVPARRVIEMVSSALMATVFACIVWIFSQSAMSSYLSGAVVMGAYEWPTWIPDFIVVVGALAIILRLLGRVIGHLGSLVTGRDLIPLPRSAGG